jgi:LCP family protein required for cell wall assembly
MTEIGIDDNDPGNGGKQKKSKKKKRIWLRILAVLVMLIMIAGIAAGVAVYKAYNYVSGELDLMNHVKLPKQDLCIDPDVDKELKNYRNILIMGIDKRKWEDIEKCRSDAMIVASINKKTGEFKMVSVVRDSFLQIDENDQLVLDKLTHAHAYGGPVNTIRAINRNLDLNIKEFVRIDWKTVADTVDCMGGLELPITKGEINEMNKYIKDTNKSLDGSKKKIKKAGKQKLNGVQVVTYCRIRKNDGDEQRAERYRAAMAAALKKVRGMKFKEIDKMADTVLPEITSSASRLSL